MSEFKKVLKDISFLCVCLCAYDVSKNTQEGWGFEGSPGAGVTGNYELQCGAQNQTVPIDS